MAKPTSKIDWTSGNAAARVEPSGIKKEAGWLAAERPPREYMNWLFYNIDLWIKYLLTANPKKTVGTDGDYATLALAMAAAAAGDHFLVISNLTITANVGASVSDIVIEFKPGVTLTKSGAADTGIALSGTRSRVVNGRFSGFTTGIQASGSFCRVIDCNFVSCTTAVQITSDTAVITGTIEE